MIGTLERSLRTLAKILVLVGGIFILVEAFLTLCNTLGRYALASPIKPTYEVSELLMVVVLSLCWLYTTDVKGHVNVDVIQMTLPDRLKKYADVFLSLVSLATLALLVWGLVKAGASFYKLGSRTDLLRIPFYPFAFLMALGAFLSALVILIQLIRAIGEWSSRSN